MKKQNTCSLCGEVINGYPAISRVDNKTEICPQCGVKEALNNYIEHIERVKKKEESK